MFALTFVLMTPMIEDAMIKQACCEDVRKREFAAYFIRRAMLKGPALHSMDLWSKVKKAAIHDLERWRLVSEIVRDFRTIGMWDSKEVYILFRFSPKLEHENGMKPNDTTLNKKLFDEMRELVGDVIYSAEYWGTDHAGSYCLSFYVPEMTGEDLHKLRSIRYLQPLPDGRKLMRQLLSASKKDNFMNYFSNRTKKYLK